SYENGTAVAFRPPFQKLVAALANPLNEGSASKVASAPSPAARPEDSVKRLLWVRTDSIGDAVLASGMLPAVQQRYPEAEIVVLCQEHVAPIYAAAPMISRTITFRRNLADDDAHLRAVIQQIAEFRPYLLLNSTRSRDVLSE